MNNITKEIHAQRGTPGETFKTEHFTDDQDAKLKRNAKSQEARILEFFREYVPAWGAVGASVIWQHISSEFEPVTSIRRALNSLAKQGKVEKTDGLRVGYYGANEHLWRLKGG